MVVTHCIIDPIMETLEVVWVSLLKFNFDGLMVTTPGLGSFENVSVKWCNNMNNFASIYRPPDSGISMFLDEFMSFYRLQRYSIVILISTWIPTPEVV